MFKTNVKITVIKADIFEDLAAEYGQVGPDGRKSTHPCPFFKVGDEFVFNLKNGIEGGEFCQWAKAAIFSNLLAVASQGGATPPEKIKDIPPHICCCSDGLRPVVFRLEVME